MITNSFYLLPNRIFHLHRILQYSVVTVLIVCYLYHHSTQHLILSIFIGLNIYQSLVLLLNLKNVAPNLKTTLTIVFIDGVITGLLIQFIGLYHALSIGIAGLFSLVYVKAFSAMTFTAICGVSIAIITGHITAFPSCDIKIFTEIVLLILMGSFLLSFCIIRGYQDKTLNEKLELVSRKNSALKSHVHNLSKYLSPRLCQSIIAKENTCLDARDRPITIFFSDMQGFSQLSEQLTPDQLSWLVNTYLSEMSEIAFRFGGTLDKIIGDSMMVFFGDPNSRGKKNDALSCVCMAIAMKEAMRNLQKRWKIAGIETPPSVRMGINTGNCRVGNFGTENKLDYTVLGSTVNLASHLESIAQANEILITEETYNLVKNHVKCTVNNSADSRWLSKDLKLYTANKMAREQIHPAGHFNLIDNL